MKTSLLQKLSAKAILIIIVFFIHIGLNVQVTHAAEDLQPVSVNTTLDSNETYNVGKDVTVAAGATLTIPAGTHLIFVPGAQIRVSGKLVVNGNPDDHVVIVGGAPAAIIPLAIPSVMTESPETQTQSPTVTSTVMLSVDAVPETQRHAGFRFDSGSSATISYLDMQDAKIALTVNQHTTVTVSHSNFSNCDTAFLGTGGATLNVSNSNFDTVAYPAQLDFHDVFTHSNNTFSTNDGLKGWQLAGEMVAGDKIKLDSPDGVYSVFNSDIPVGASLTISPGVTVFNQDNGTLLVEGTLSANGTADNPITFQGDGLCTVHAPIILFDKDSAATMGHVVFNNLCNGLKVSQGTLTMTNDSFNTIAGTAVADTQESTVNASDITMHDIYQAFSADAGSRLNLSNASINVVNGSTAILVSGVSPFSGNTISVDTAPTCLEVSDNSSITVRNMTLTNCAKYGIYSTNNTVDGPSGITMTDSEISHSGSALYLIGAQVTNVSNNKFHDDTVGVTLKNMPATILINNWWGSNAGPTISSNPGGNGDSIVTTNVTSVTYKPWIGMASLEHNPVIIVPGITGSVLTKNYGDKSELWPNITTLALSPTDNFLNDLELLQDGTTNAARPVSVGDIIRSAPGTDVFDGLIATLIQSGYKEGVDLFVMPYDWRLSNTTTQLQLKNAIANALAVSGKSKVNLIGHSMGGLLIQDYLAQNPTAPIDHLFLIGSPNLGAPKAFKALMYGDDMGYNFSVAGALNIHVLNPDRIKIITQNMPSVYELLPSKKYFDTIGSYVAQNTFLNNADTTALMKEQGRNSSMFPFATTLHNSIDNLNLSGVPTYDFVGCGQTKTIGKMILTKKESFTSTGISLTDAYHLQYVAGDGTVPRASASSTIGATNYFVNAGSHGTLPSTTQVKNAIASILNGTTPANANGLSTLANSCALAGEVVEIHSPVTLDIYDAQGRHTGPTTSGDIEYGIPNVDYETIDDEKFAFLPEGPTYTIVNHAQSIGSYDMYISHSGIDDTVTNETYYHDVPLTTDKTVGTLTINPNSTNISMDQDGDGVVDSTVPPTSVLVGNQANDITAPITTATIQDQTVTLSATDDSSGVLNTKYSIDGINWSTYIKSFQAAVGITVQYLSMDKAGNVEDIKKITIPKNDDATQTPETPAATVTTDTGDNTINNYYYDDNTPVENDDTTDDQTTDVSDTSPQDQNDNDTPSDNTQTSDTSKPDIITSQTDNTSTENITPVTGSSISSKPFSNTLPVLSDSKKIPLLATSLLASANTVVPTGNIILLAIIGILCLIVIIYMRKYWSKKKSQDLMK